LAHVPTASPALTFTGERFTPEVRGPIWYEHWHRYAFVADLVRGKRVLDAACGEGYGSYLLARAAAQVTGVDISAGAIAHARERYPLANLEFVPGSVTQLPLADACVDAVISFETIEHLSAQREMLAEFRRVLTADGLLVISSPNRPVYNEAGLVENHYHVAELDRAELEHLLAPGFPLQAWYGQRVLAQSALWAEGGSGLPVQYLTLPAEVTRAASAPAPPMYFVVVCAAAGVALPACTALSLFDDGAMALWRDYARALVRERQLAWDELDARAMAEERLTVLVGAVNDLASEKEAGLAKDRQIAAMAGAHAAFLNEVAVHAATRERLAYRESMRGWLRLPFSLLKRRLSALR
jgi:SAM-dependent methyltransferase